MELITYRLISTAARTDRRRNCILNYGKLSRQSISCPRGKCSPLNANIGYNIKANARISALIVRTVRSDLDAAKPLNTT